MPSRRLQAEKQPDCRSFSDWQSYYDVEVVVGPASGIQTTRSRKLLSILAVAPQMV